MIRRIAAFAVLLWVFGFAIFAVSLPQPVDAVKTDAVIVLTGGEGRIDRGLEALEKGWARRMLVSGVGREVKPREFRAEYRVSSRLMACCVTLGYESFDTRSNATEAMDWIARNRITSLRMVTTDWHMPRAYHEFARLAPDGLEIVRDAVPSQPRLKDLFIEYNKLLARKVSALWGD